MCMSKTLQKKILRLSVVFVIAGVSVVFARSVEATRGGTCITQTVVKVVPGQPDGTMEVTRCDYFACLGETQLGCIEAFEATDANGVFVSGIDIGNKIWRIPGLDGLCGDEVRVNAISGVDDRDSIQFSFWPASCTDEQWANKNYFHGLPKDREFKLVFRDLEFPYTKMNSSFQNLRTKIEPIAPTGFRITVSGSLMALPIAVFDPPYVITGYGSFGFLGKMKEQFDAWTANTIIGFFADPRDSCNGTGYASVNSNAYFSGSPTWDFTNKTLSFDAVAPHFGPTGEVFKGIYEAVISLGLAKCRWGLDPETIPEQLTLEIYDENNGKQSAVVTTTVRDGFVYLTARGFHYSVVKFVARVGKLESAPVQSIISKVKVAKLKCQNLKTKKTVKFAKTTCPKGWKKVK